MITIIKRGTPQAEQKFLWTCTSCGTVYQYQRSDCESFKDGTFVYCPVCKHGHEHSEKTRVPASPNACCENERRSMDGGCLNCGDPCY